jgi:hypothetical protein
MSNRYKGAVISATPPTTTGGDPGSASGAWTLEQQMQAQAAGLWPSPPPPNFIEDVFSTYLYTGNSSTQTITNGIDLSTKGGIVWCKGRSAAGYSNVVYDTINGVNKRVATNLTNALTTAASSLTAFNTTGFSLGADAGGEVNQSAINYVSWTFREQAKFFDVVTYTGTGSLRTVAHSLGSVPGCIMIKNLSDTDGWLVYHRGIGATKTLALNSSGAADNEGATYFNDTAPTSTVFTVNIGGKANQAGNNYVAYVFAHDAGGFGLTGTDNVVSCGTYTTDGSGVATVSLGYEPQWVLTKATSGTFGTTDWVIADNMRGMPAPPTTDGVGGLFPNTSGAEDNNFNRSVHPTSTGFVANQYASTPYIYIAIRRGPMKVPTSGTSVFSTVLNTGNGTAGTVLTAGFPVDLVLGTIRTPDYSFVCDMDRLRGATKLIQTGTNSAETTDAQGITSFANQTGVVVGTGINNSWPNQSPWTYVNWMFRRAPGFFDEVCYTGTEVSGQTFNHNLGAVPEMMIVKSRSGTTDWTVYHSALGASARIYLNATNAANTGTAAPWNSTAPTSSVFSLGNAGATNLSGGTFVNYLFATCAGVSKVGSYTGTGALQTINCGFAAGARFVFIKRTDSTGDWYVYDSSRGMTSGNDPYLFLNTVIAEVTNTNYVDTTAVGFQVTAAAPAAINANGGTFIFLAIA